MRIIDADKLRAYFVDLAKDRDYGFGDVGRMITVKIEHIIDAIENAPTIEAVPKDFHDKTCEAMAKRHTEEIQRLMPKRGKWVDCKGGWKCTACDKWASFTSDFCPNCGADMREREGE